MSSQCGRAPRGRPLRGRPASGRKAAQRRQGALCRGSDATLNDPSFRPSAEQREAAVRPKAGTLAPSASFTPRSGRRETSRLLRRHTADAGEFLHFKHLEHLDALRGSLWLPSNSTTAGIEANGSGTMCQGAHVRHVGSGNAIVHLRESRFLNLTSICRGVPSRTSSRGLKFKR